MAKYNILRDDENKLPEKEKKQEKSGQMDSETPEMNVDSQEKQEQQTSHVLTNKETPDDDFFSSDIFSGIEKEQKEPEIEIADDKVENFLDDTAPNQESVSEKTETEETTEAEEESTYEESGNMEPEKAQDSKQPQPYIDDYEDHKQDSVNYKPILIGISAVAAIVVIFIIVSNLFFGGQGETEPEQQPETAEERMLREQTERKQSILADINNQTTQRLKAIQLLTGIGQKNVKYSSILLYGNSLQLEVFSSDRSGLAKFNQTVKNDRRVGNLKLESVDNRPGTSGGLFALFNVELKDIPSKPSSPAQNFATVSPASWLDEAKKQQALMLKYQRQVATKRENLFSVNRNEYEFQGSMQNCLALLDNMVTANQNISVHKLTLLPTDQRKMTPASYSLKLILDFYM